MSVDMQTFLDSAINDAVGVRVRCGEQKNPRTIGIILVGPSNLNPSRFANFDPTEVETWEECFDSVTAMLEGVGWGVEPGEECARLHLLGSNGHQLRTWSRTQWPEVAGQVDVTAMIASELIRLSSEMRRMSTATIESQAETIQALSQTNLTLRAESLDSYRAEIEASAESALVSTLAEMEQGIEPEENALETTAAGILQGLAAQFLPSPGTDNGSTAKDFILSQIKNDPEMAKSLVQDPDVVELFLNATNSIEPETVEPLPNPMDE